MKESEECSMAFDGIVTRAVTEELAKVLTTGRVSKIHQPHKTELILVLRANRINYKVLLSMNAQYARIQLTDKNYENPQEPPTFCMLLRKHLDGAILESVKQIEFERIVHFQFKAKNDIGDDVQKTLIVETMGKHSNIILIETTTGKILDAMKRLSPAVNRHRTVLPGHIYVAPPEQNKLNPAKVSTDELLKALDFNAGKLDHQLVNVIEGFSPLIAREVLHRAGLPTRDRITAAFSELQNDIKNNDFRPQIYRNPSHKDDFHVLSITHLSGEKESFESPSQMLESFYTFKAESDLVRQRASDLGHIIANEKKKNERKLKKLRVELREAEDASHYQLYGELITAHMHAIKKGDKKAEVINYYDENQSLISISLDPNKTPSENAQKYFRKYNKLKTAKVEIEKHIEITENEIVYLESILQQIESASLKDILEIREELEAGGYVKQKVSKHRKQKPQKPTPEQYFASDGTLIWVGKNNRQNDYLTMRMASENDTWLHTKDIPGSHVVIKSGKISEETLIEAASLAAFFSKAKLSSQVPVDATLIRHVHKPNGAKPGYVIYDHQTTVYVTPDEQLVCRLKEKPKD
jgi:predicted ribosome quality control (RQC) complex YloA/Tae2 family protein